MRIRSQKIRQALLVTGDPLDPNDLPEKMEFFDEQGNPLMLGGVTARNTVTHTTTSLAIGASVKSVLTVYPGWRAFKFSTNRPARVRLYPTTAQQDADYARPIGTKPPLNSGRLLEVVTMPGLLTLLLNPAVDFTSEAQYVSNFYISVANLDSVAGTVISTFNYVRTE